MTKPFLPQVLHVQIYSTLFYTQNEKYSNDVLSPALALNMETAPFSESLASTNQSMQPLNPKEYNQNHHYRETLKSHIMKNTASG
jgi:hypothetical protein